MERPFYYPPNQNHIKSEFEVTKHMKSHLSGNHLEFVIRDNLTRELSRFLMESKIVKVEENLDIPPHIHFNDSTVYKTEVFVFSREQLYDYQKKLLEIFYRESCNSPNPPMRRGGSTFRW